MRTSCVLGHLGFYLLDAKSNCEELFRAGSDSACSSHWPAVRKFLNRWPHRPWQLAAGVSLGVMVIERTLRLRWRFMRSHAAGSPSSLQRRSPSISILDVQPKANGGGNSVL